MLYTRPHEVLHAVRIADAGYCSNGKCLKPVSEGIFYWSDDAPFTVTTGQINSTQRFPKVLHSDGSAPCHEHLTSLFPLPRCPKCSAVNAGMLRQMAWMDEVTCFMCGDVRSYSIGD